MRVALRPTTLVLAAVLVVGPVGTAAAVQPAIPAAGASTASVESVGTAVARAVPLAVTVGDRSVELGGLDLLSTTDEDAVPGAPWSTAVLVPMTIDTVDRGRVEVASDGDTGTGLAWSATTPLGPLTLDLMGMTATADASGRWATSALEQLGISTTVLDTLDLAVTLDEVTTRVDDESGSASLDLVLGNVDVTLAALLGDVLDDLPLGDLLALADQLGIAAPVDLTGAEAVLAAATDLVEATAAATAAATAVETAAGALIAADLLDPLAGYGDVAALEATIVTLGTLDPVGDPIGTQTVLAALVADADVIAAGCDGVIDLGALADSVTALTACLQAVVDGFDAAVLGLADELAALTDAVTEYAAAVAAAVAASAVLDGGGTEIADLVDAVAALVDDLLAAPLVGLGEVALSQDVRAVAGDVVASSARSSCAATSLTLLGGDPIALDACASGQLAAVLDTIGTAVTALDAVLDTVGVVEGVDGVQLALFDVVEDTVVAGDGDLVTATSTIEVLRLVVPSLTVDVCSVADGSACSLGVDLDALLDGGIDTVLGGMAGALDGAQATVTDALGAVDALLVLTDTVVDVTDEAGAGTVVSAAVAALGAVLDGLEPPALGDLDEVVLPRVELVVDPMVQASHRTVTSPGTDDPTEPTPGVTPDPAPDGPALPNTGGGAVLVALVAMGFALALRSRRRRA